MTPGSYLVGGVVYRAGRRTWTPADVRALELLYPDVPNDVIARFLGRTVNAINARSDAMGLHKSARYLASPAACRLRRGDDIGTATRFRKGQAPANKGLRRPGWGPGRMKETQFKKGQSRNKMPLGATRLIEGYVYRKVSEIPFMPYTVNWKLEHHLVWTAAHGAIPAGHKLRFVNGDRQDIRLDNLELVSDAAMMARNTVHNLPKPLASTIQLLGALKRQIRRRAGHGQEQDRRSA